MLIGCANFVNILGAFAQMSELYVGNALFNYWKK